MMGINGAGMGGGLWILVGLFWVVLIVVIIWLVVRLLPANGSSAGPLDPTQPPSAMLRTAEGTATQESPVAILDRRFARGELDLETYQAHRAALIAGREDAR